MRILFIGLLGLSLFSLTSCGNIREEVWIEPDNSCRLTYTTDASDLIPLMSAAATRAVADKENLTEMVILDLIGRESIDSTLSFHEIFENLDNSGDEKVEDLKQDILNDSDLDDAERDRRIAFLDQLEDILLRVEIDREKEIMNFHILQEFKDLEQKNNFLDDLALSSHEKGIENSGFTETMTNMLGGNSSFEWRENRLVVRIKKMNKEDMGAAVLEPLSMMSVFLENPTYELVINLPKKVKEVDHPSAVIEKKNRVVLSVPLEMILEEDIEFSILTK